MVPMVYIIVTWLTSIQVCIIYVISPWKVPHNIPYVHNTATYIKDILI